MNYNNLTLEELLEKSNAITPNTGQAFQLRTIELQKINNEVLRRLIDSVASLEETTKKLDSSNRKLSEKTSRLTTVLTIVSIIVALAGVVAAFYQLKK